MKEFLQNAGAILLFVFTVIFGISAISTIFLVCWRNEVRWKLNPVDKTETRYEIGIDKDTHKLQLKKTKEATKTFRGLDE